MQNRLRPVALSLIIASLGLTSTAYADEGQWQPHQMPQLKKELQRIGIAIPAEQLSDLSKHPMSAIVSLGGCSASFVSPKGLVVTNHHCAYGAIQKNSTAENNLLSKGFLAKSLEQELPADAGTAIYVTDKVENVTDKVHAGLTKEMSGRARIEKIEKNIKQLIAECEQDKAYRCSVPSFHRGHEYYRIRQLYIRDVRIVYAPSDQIGNYGGEIDNFEWPRHTGDFAFLRAYVGKDGRPAAYSKDNVPYQSKDFLVVSEKGISNGDPILLAGYPGRTSRYKLPAEIRFARDSEYPAKIAELRADLDTIAAATADNASAKVTYASVVKGINNVYKKTKGLYEGFQRKDIAAIKDQQDQAFRNWYAQRHAGSTLLQEQDAIIQKNIALSEQEFAWSVASKSALLKAAMNLYRLALEKQKPDSERESDYQERDMNRFVGRLNNLKTSLLPEVDQARFSAALARYAKLDQNKQIAGLADLLPKQEQIASLYQQTQLNDPAVRLAWMNKSVDEFKTSNDAFIRLAVRLHQIDFDLENQRKELDGHLERIVPQAMQALISWKQEQGKPVYPDANSTLRVTYGTVAPYSPRDGISKGPFTVVEGILEKYTGQSPFEAPAKLLSAIREKRYANYADKNLGSVPVNFLSSADTTGGNSGSAVLNKHGQLIGLNFDSTYESITKDWYFDPVITRAIHVDIRYLLWVMKEVDRADNVLQEMSIR